MSGAETRAEPKSRRIAEQRLKAVPITRIVFKDDNVQIHFEYQAGPLQAVSLSHAAPVSHHMIMRGFSRALSLAD